MASIRRWSVQAGWSGPEGGALPTTAWRKAKRCHGDRAAKKNLFVLLPRQQLWIGGEGDGLMEREREGRVGERGKRKRWKGRDWEEEGVSENEEGEGTRSRLRQKGYELKLLLFPPSLPCLCWMILDCVGEFTVCCNLIPNKVTQQILLSQIDTEALLCEGSSNRTQ